MSSQPYLSEDDNLADLISRMPAEESAAWHQFQHLRVDPGYIGRIYIIYRPTGLTQDRQHKDPEIIGQVKIVGWVADAVNGAEMTLEDMQTGETLRVTHVPVRLFNYDVFVAVPPYQRLRFEGRRIGEDVRRSLQFSLLVKTKVRSSFYSKGVTFCEAPKGFKELYPHCKTPIKFI